MSISSFLRRILVSAKKPSVMDAEQSPVAKPAPELTRQEPMICRCHKNTWRIKYGLGINGQMVQVYAECASCPDPRAGYYYFMRREDEFRGLCKYHNAIGWADCHCLPACKDCAARGWSTCHHVVRSHKLWACAACGQNSWRIDHEIGKIDGHEILVGMKMRCAACECERIFSHETNGWHIYVNLGAIKDMQAR